MSDYELGYTPNNLNRILAESGLTNAALARLLGVNADSVCRWRTPLGRDRHADMPALRWLQAVNICEADYAICISFLEDKILTELAHQNLVYVPGQLEPIHLIASYGGHGKWRVWSQYGKAKDSSVYSLEVGIDVGLIDYIHEEGSDEEIELDASSVHIDNSAMDWAKRLMAELGPFSWDGRKVA